MNLMKPERAKDMLEAIFTSVKPREYPENWHIVLDELSNPERWIVHRLVELDGVKSNGWKTYHYGITLQGEWKRLKRIARPLGLYPAQQKHIDIIKVVRRLEGKNPETDLKNFIPRRI